MNLLNTNYPNFHLVAISEILDELGIEVTGYLMNREKLGIPLRKILSKKLHTMGNDTLVVNMAGIEEMTTSVAEEIGPLLFQELTKCHQQNKRVFLTYCNVTQEIARGLDGTFKNKGSELEASEKFSIVVFSTFHGGIFANHQFLGQEIPTALKDILDVIYRTGVVNSSDLEEREIKAASRKLNELAKCYPWLFYKVQKSLDTGSRAWAYFYAPIVPVVEEIGGNK